MQHSADAYANNAWIVEASTVNADGSQTLKLKNAATGRYITSVGSYSDREGSPVSVGTSISKANVTLTYVPKYKELRIMVGGKSLFPLPSGQVNAGATTSASSDAPRVQGAGWKAEAVKVITINCKDDKGAVLGKVLRSVPTSVAELKADFEGAVDDYLAYCKEAGIQPRKSYTGTLNIRISPDTHSRIAALASKAGISINAYIRQTLDRQVLANA